MLRGDGANKVAKLRCAARRAAAKVEFILRTGYEELDALLARPQPLRVIIHLRKVELPNEYIAENWQLNETQKRARIETLRVEGNEAFKSKKLR